MVKVMSDGFGVEEVRGAQVRVALLVLGVDEAAATEIVPLTSPAAETVPCP